MASTSKFAFNKSKALKLIQGNPGGRKLNHNEPKVVIEDSVPNPPKFLNEIGLEYFESMGKKLLDIKVMTPNDWLTLALMADQVSIYCMARRDVEETELIHEWFDTEKERLHRSANPAVKIMDNALAKIMSYGDRFGLNPTTRSRTEVVGSFTNSSLDQFAKEVG